MHVRFIINFKPFIWISILILVCSYYSLYVLQLKGINQKFCQIVTFEIINDSSNSHTKWQCSKTHCVLTIISLLQTLFMLGFILKLNWKYKVYSIFLEETVIVVLGERKSHYIRYKESLETAKRHDIRQKQAKS